MDTRDALATLAPLLLANGPSRTRGLLRLDEKPFCDALNDQLRSELREAFQVTTPTEQALEQLSESSSNESRAAFGMLSFINESRRAAHNASAAPESASGMSSAG